jgi:hypothetical protein
VELARSNLAEAAFHAHVDPHHGSLEDRRNLATSAMVSVRPDTAPITKFRDNRESDGPGYSRLPSADGSQKLGKSFGGGQFRTTTPAIITAICNPTGVSGSVDPSFEYPDLQRSSLL